jgi:RNA polymerase sigma-70 factor (ECF subfamily)
MNSFTQHRPLLFGIAYRMLGSVMDAEDIVQETFLRWREGSAENPRAYLARITTNLCLDQLRSAAYQREEYIGAWLPDPLITPPVDAIVEAESLSVAFLLMLQKLAPVERAAVLLRDVFDFEYAEIGEMVGKSEANCRQIVRRSRLKLRDSRVTRDVSAETQTILFTQFLSACTTGDLAGLVNLLQDEIVFVSDSNGKVPAARHPIFGSDKVARFLLGLVKRAPQGLSFDVVNLNGANGFVAYQDDVPILTMTVQMIGEKIGAIYAMRNPDKLRHLRPNQ